MPTTNRKLRVFLCYASQDESIVHELNQQLLAEGWIDPWLDKEKLLPGDDWEIKIEKSVESADVVIVCLSKKSVEKEGYYQKEIRKVLDVAEKKPEGAIFIIPLLLEKCVVPRSLSKLQWIDYYPDAERRERYSNLLKSLNLKVPQIKDTNITNEDLIIYPDLDIIDWKSLQWWGQQLKNGLKGPRAIITVAAALAGLSCNACVFPIIVPIQTPIIGLIAAHFSVRQDKRNIFSRKDAGVVGLISAMFVVCFQLSFAVMATVYFASSSSETDYDSYWPIMIGVNFVNFIVTGILGYFAGYLSVTID